MTDDLARIRAHTTGQMGRRLTRIETETLLAALDAAEARLQAKDRVLEREAKGWSEQVAALTARAEAAERERDENLGHAKSYSDAAKMWREECELLREQRVALTAARDAAIAERNDAESLTATWMRRFDAMAADRAALDDLLKMAREALEPFRKDAAYGDERQPDYPDNMEIGVAVMHLRRARAACEQIDAGLEKQKAPPGGEPSGAKVSTQV